MIPVACACGKTLRAPDHLAGKRVKCPGCGQVTAVPAPGAPEADPLPRASPASYGERAAERRRTRATTDAEMYGQIATKAAAIALLIGFLMPAVGFGGTVMFWEGLGEHEGLDLVIYLWPLVAGVGALIVANSATGLARPLVTLLLTTFPYLLALVALASSPLGAAPMLSGGGLVILVYFGLVAAVAGCRSVIVLGARLPNRVAAGLGGGIFVLFMLLPQNGSVPLVEVFRVWQFAVMVLPLFAVGALGVLVLLLPDFAEGLSAGAMALFWGFMIVVPLMLVAQGFPFFLAVKACLMVFGYLVLSVVAVADLLNVTQAAATA